MPFARLNRGKGTTLAAILCGVACWGLVPNAAEAGWTCQTLDGPGSGGGGGRVSDPMHWAAAAVMFNGNPWPVYGASNTASSSYWVRYGTDAFGTWQFATADGPNAYAGVAAASVFNNEIHVVYRYGSAGWRMAHGAYGAWTHSTITSGGASSARASSVVFNGYLFVFIPGDIAARRYDGSSWTTHDIPNTYATGDTAVTVFNNQLRLYYYESGSLREAISNDGASWSVSVLDGIGGKPGHTNSYSVGLSPSAVSTTAGPRVFYHDAVASTLRVAAQNNGVWSFSVVDTIGGAGLAGSAAIMSPSGPKVYYHDGSLRLREAAWNGSTYVTSIIDGSTSASCTGRQDIDISSSMSAVLDNGYPRVFYIDDTNQRLRTAFFTP